MVRYSESISVSEDSARVDRIFCSELCYDVTKKYSTELRVFPSFKPIKRSNTIVCFRKNSTGRHYINSMDLRPILKPRSYSERIAVFPKTEKKMFVSALRYNVDTSDRWFETRVDLDPCELMRSKVSNTATNENEGKELYNSSVYVTKNAKFYPKTFYIECSEDDANNNSYVTKWKDNEPDEESKHINGYVDDRGLYGQEEV